MMARLSTLLGRRLIPGDVVVMSVEHFERQKTMVNTLAWRAACEGHCVDHETALLPSLPTLRPSPAP